MRLELIRHGATTLQEEHRYQGITDAPLSDRGRVVLRRVDDMPEHVIVTPLKRTKETAAILFPDARQIVVPGFQEMNFGRFEGRNYLEMEHDPDYRAWVDGMCLGRCPGGESKAEYVQRVTEAFTALMDRALAEHWQDCIIVAHGGTQMALLEQFGAEHRDYYSLQLPCGHGYVLDGARWYSHRQLIILRQSCYISDSQ